MTPLDRILREYSGPLDMLRNVIAQNGLCGICGKGLALASAASGPRRATRDHVWPTRQAGGPDPIGRAGMLGNKLVAHLDCNNRKDNRAPTGCELIILSAVNARLGLANGSAFKTEPAPWTYRGSRYG